MCLEIGCSEGEIKVYNSKEKRLKPRHLFLFSDCLLIAKREGKAKFWLKVYIALSPTIRVEDVLDTTTAEKGLFSPQHFFYFPLRFFGMC
jgi:hypothetical protein